MASNSSGRKRNQRSKASSHHNKSNHVEIPNPKIRDMASQQQNNAQQNPSLDNQIMQQHQKQPQSQQHNKQQQKQQKQQQQQLQVQQAEQKQMQQQQQLQQQQQQQQQQQIQQQPKQQPFSNSPASVLSHPETNNPQSFKTRLCSIDNNAKRKVIKTTQDSNISLHTAIFWRRHDIVESLLQNGAKQCDTDLQGNTAFMIACRVGDLRIMVSLWEAGDSKQDINHTNKDGDTALHLCTINGHEDGCRFLLSKNAGLRIKNKSGNTPLHLAAKCDHVGVCNLFLNSMMPVACDTSHLHGFLLDENEHNQTAICVSILHQRAQITRILLDLLTAHQQATYLCGRLQNAICEPKQISFDVSGPAVQGCQEIFLQGVLISLSVLLIRLAEKCRHGAAAAQASQQLISDSRLDYCLSTTDVIRIIVRIACSQYINKQIVQIACFLLIYLIEGVVEENIFRSADKTTHDTSVDSGQVAKTKVAFLEQFLECNGPNDIILKINDIEVADQNDAIVTTTLALPVVSLVRSVAGRTWLESNKCHLTFLKELILQNRSILGLLITACPLLTMSHIECICQEFVRFVELLEAKDREQNLAELLWEEERDRKRRERKKQKQQSKKQLTAKTCAKSLAPLQLQVLEVSSEEETGEDIVEGKSNIMLLKKDLPEINHDQTFGELPTSQPECNINSTSIRQYVHQAIRSNDSLDEKYHIQTDHESKKKCKSDFPSASNNSESNTVRNTSDVAEKRSEMEEVMVVSDDNDVSSATASNAMRWADVAKIGCAFADKELQPRVRNKRGNSGDWPISGNIRSVDMFKEVEDEVNIHSVQGMFDQNTFENSWFNVVNPYSNVDTNSDEETSSCSSSSLESHCSVVSDSLLHTQNASLVCDKARDDIEIEDCLMSKNVKADPCSSITQGGHKKRRKMRKATRSMPKNDTSILSPAFASSNGNSVLPLPKDETFLKKDLKLPIVGDPLFRTRSDDIPNASPWANVEKASIQCPDKVQKHKDSVSAAIKMNHQWKHNLSSILKTDTPAALPPLKRRDPNIYKIGVYDKGGVDYKSDERKDKLFEQNVFSISQLNNKSSFSPKNAPLSSLKNATSILNASNPNLSNSIIASSYVHQSIDNKSSNIVSWSNMSAIVPTVTASQLPFASLSTGSQFTPYTPPPPGFQAIKHANFAQIMAGSLQSMDKDVQLCDVDINDTGIKPQTPSTSGRLITTVLLDKVRNPPLSLQQNRVPLLSTLAWNYGQESKLSWSRLIQSKPTTSIAASFVETPAVRRPISTNGDNCSDTPMALESTEIATLQHTAKTYEHCTNVPLSKSLPITATNTQAFPSFSTILVSRMQQRSHTRNSVNPLDCAQDDNSIASSRQNNIISNASGISNPDQKLSTTQSDLASTLNMNMSVSIGLNAHNSLKQQHPAGPNMRSDQTGHQQCYRYLQKTDKMSGVTYSQVSNDFEMKINGVDAVSNGKGNNGDKDVPVNYKVHDVQHLQTHKSVSRSSSPLVFFPENIRDDAGGVAGGSNFPSFHDVQTSDFLSEMFSDPLFSDNIAINQIRQKILTSHLTSQSDTSSQSSDSSDIDLDYYASLYQMKFRHVLGNHNTQNNSFYKSSLGNALGNQTSNRHSVPKDRSNIFGGSSLPAHSSELFKPRKHSLRWHRHLQKLLDLPWTTRRQYGNIILPHPAPEFSIGIAENIFILLGYLMDGTEVAVLAIDKTLVKTIPRMIDTIMSNPELDKYFLTQCKSFSESANIQYIAMDLYEYTLCEYLQLYLPTCSPNMEVYTSLVWQLMQALCFLHHKLCVPHGYLAPCWIFINAEGQLRLIGFGINTPIGEKNKTESQTNTDVQVYDHRPSCWGANEDVANDLSCPSFFNDIRAAGKLAYFILTKGQHLFGVSTSLETEINFMRDHLSSEAFDLVSPMLMSDHKTQPTIEQCLKHPMFWSSDKKFRLVLIVGSDVLTEMKTGVALTGTGAPTMMEILSLIDINMVSPNWIHEVDSTVLKEMRSFRVYKNNLAELTLFVYNCCLHFDKLSNVAKEVLDDPCKYFQNLFPGLFMAIYRSLKSSDRIDRTCYKPFF